jgi:NAD(P)-dependent dehydrogenase (short-subunit alcohol dehydrogenase family)
MRLKDKVAVVTGGARGIGAGIARCLAAEGARLALIDIDGPSTAIAWPVMFSPSALVRKTTSLPMSSGDTALHLIEEDIPQLHVSILRNAHFHHRGQHFPSACPQISWTDRVDAAVLQRQLQRQALGERDHAGLRRRDLP